MCKIMKRVSNIPSFWVEYMGALTPSSARTKETKEREGAKTGG